uniref:proline--tRNA ligase n=1 Tax=Eutreptiella gymnastica TaxID=73025 RepID=A0A7S4FTH2_9EUGL
MQATTTAASPWGETHFSLTRSMGVCLIVGFAAIGAALSSLLTSLGRSRCQSSVPPMVMMATTGVEDDVKTDPDEIDTELFEKFSSSSSEKIVSMEKDYSKWYQQVIACADLIDVSPVRGCMVLKPNGFAIWEEMKADLDKRFKATGHRNAYFPLFIPQSFLSKEAEHVEGFAKECAVVTHHRLRSVTDENGNKGVEPDPAAKLEESLIVRPTSETIIWNMYGRWIQSYRDLPVLINQWANVVRWEMRTRPFLRSAEFLWQEGHTAHATSDEAIAESRRMLDVYVDHCKEVLAIPVIKGEKSENERFAGADMTLTIEAMMQNGWALQSGTSHFLGQNFAKAFDVKYQDDEGAQQYVWATSWGVSTRLIGALIMTHSDDTGLVLPPKVAPTQIVIIPILKKNGPREEVLAFTEKVRETLAVHYRVEVDARENVKPGSKYYEWERKGVPLRMEIGPRDMEKGAAFCARRIGGGKFSLSIDDDLVANVQEVFDTMHEEMYAAAAARLEDRTYRVETYQEMLDKLGDGGFFLVPWKADNENEDKIKDDCKATIRCYPMEYQAEAEGKTCFYSGEPATHMAIFARAY